MGEKIRVTVTVDKEIWRKVGEMSKSLGFNKSGLVDMILRSMVLAENTTLPDLFGSVLNEILAKHPGMKKGKK